MSSNGFLIYFRLKFLKNWNFSCQDEDLMMVFGFLHLCFSPFLLDVSAYFALSIPFSKVLNSSRQFGCYSGVGALLILGAISCLVSLLADFILSLQDLRILSVVFLVLFALSTILSKALGIHFDNLNFFGLDSSNLLIGLISLCHRFFLSPLDTAAYFALLLSFSKVLTSVFEGFRCYFDAEINLPLDVFCSGLFTTAVLPGLLQIALPIPLAIPLLFALLILHSKVLGISSGIVMFFGMASLYGIANHLLCTPLLLWTPSFPLFVYPTPWQTSSCFALSTQLSKQLWVFLGGWNRLGGICCPEQWVCGSKYQEIILALFAFFEALVPA